MKELFLSILNASLHGSIVIAAVLILRLVLKKAPRALFCLLWLLAGLRLVLPFEIESRFSLQPDMEPVVLNQTVVIPATAETPDVQLSLPQEEMPADTQQEAPREQTGFVYIEENGTVRVPELGDILCWVWLAGAAVMLTGSMISYFRLKRRLREAWKTEDGAWTCPELDTAFVLGILKPRIYLPAGLKEPERGLILNHERNFHCYDPLHYTHQGAYWVQELDKSLRYTFEESGVTEETFERLFAPAIEAAAKYGAPLYCGEYGVIDKVPPEDAVKWFRVINAVFEKHGIARAAWSYKQMDFGISDARWDAVRDELLKVL